MAMLGAFTTEQAARLSGLSKRQVVYWAETDVLVPSLSAGGEHRPYGRIYSFQDIVALRTLALLRKRFSLGKLRELGHWLKQHYEHPWSSIRFYVAGRDIVFADPATGLYLSNRPIGQGVLEVHLEPIARQVSRDLAAQMTAREPGDLGVISRHRYVMRNDWVVAGTRIPVWAIQELHADGYDAEQIIRDYPELTHEDIAAALAFDLPAEHRHAS